MYCIHNVSTCLYCPQCDFEESRDIQTAKNRRSPYILFSTRPDYLKNAANHAIDGCDAFLDPILPLLSLISCSDLKMMHPETLLSVARIVSWRSDSSTALNLLSCVIKKLSVADLLSMHPKTVSHIGYAASVGSPSALNALSVTLCNLSMSALSSMHGDTLYHIALASLAGYHCALHALTKLICSLPARFYTILHPDTFFNIVNAYKHNQDSRTLCALADFYCSLDHPNQLDLDPDMQLANVCADLFILSTPPLTSGNSSISSSAFPCFEPESQRHCPPERREALSFVSDISNESIDPNNYGLRSPSS